LVGLVVLALEAAECVWLESSVKTGLVDWKASSTAHPPPMQTQDSGWLLVFLVLRAFGVWGVACVVQQHQNRRPDRERAFGAAGDTICLNPGKGSGCEAADSRSCSGGGGAPHRTPWVSFAAQKRGLSRRGRMARKREKREKRRAMKTEWRETACKQAVERGAPERKQVEMQKEMKEMRRQSALGVLLGVMLVLSQAGSAAALYACKSVAHCTYGGCNGRCVSTTHQSEPPFTPQFHIKLTWSFSESDPL
jgi:hypothetical protein